MTTGIVLGIDIGTSGVRIAAMNADQRMVALASASMPAPERVEGHTRQDPAIWWEAVQGTLADLGRRIDLGAVQAVAVDGTSGTILPVDEAGRPCGPASLYNDVAGPETVARVEANAPAESAARGRTSALARAIDCLAAVPQAHRILHQADWIAGLLMGRFDTSDENNALKSGYDPVARRWPAWIAATGMDVARLPRVLPAGTAMGAVDGTETGLRAGTVVVAGTTDGCAAFLATGAEQAGDGVTSLGTTLVLKLLSDRPIAAPHYGLYSHRIGDTWLAGGASNSGGAALLAHFSRERMAELEPELRPERPTGLDFYPLPGPGERFPINDPLLVPRFAPRPVEDAVFFQGLLEGIGGIEKLGYDRMHELGGPALRSVRSVGGGTRNQAWTAIRHRLLGVPMLEPIQAEAACGAARLARRGLLSGSAP